MIHSIRNLIEAFFYHFLLLLFSLESHMVSEPAMAFDPNCSASSFSRSFAPSLFDAELEFFSVAKALHYSSIKLGMSNYLFWKAQVLAIVRPYDLSQFLNKHPPPPKYLPHPESNLNSESNSNVKGSDASILNSDYMNWIKSDQLLLGWLFSTIEQEVLVQVIHYESSSEVWLSLENLYSQQTVAKSFQLKQQLRSIKKYSLSVKNYIL